MSAILQRFVGAFGILGSFSEIDDALFVVEHCMNLLAVILFANAYPDTFRTVLWKYGGSAGWNSDPRWMAYTYALSGVIPETPFIWNQQSTDSNLAISVASFTLSSVRGVAEPPGYIPTWMALMFDTINSLIWVLCIANQLSGDMSDPAKPSPLPWYLNRGCRESKGDARRACWMMNIALHMSVAMLTLAVVRLLFDLAWGMKSVLRHWVAEPAPRCVLAPENPDEPDDAKCCEHRRYRDEQACCANDENHIENKYSDYLIYE